MSTPDDPKFWETFFDRALLVAAGIGAVLVALGNFRKKAWKAARWMFTDEESGADKIVAAIAKGFADSNANTLAVNQRTADNLREVLTKYGYDVTSIKSEQEKMRETLGRIEREVGEVRRDIASLK